MLYRIRNIEYYRDGGTIELETIDGRYYCIHKDTKKIYTGKIEENREYVTNKEEIENIISAIDTYKKELLLEHKYLDYTLSKVKKANL